MRAAELKVALEEACPGALEAARLEVYEGRYYFYSTILTQLVGQQEILEQGIALISLEGQPRSAQLWPKTV